jgi:pyridoxal phosphate enzyme (YggS family)
MSSAPDLARSIEAVRSRIEGTCRRTGRGLDEVRLVAVTKTVAVDVVRQAARLGVEDLAENHANDLARKASLIDARWHFIGKLQAGTAPRVADHAHVIHSGEPGRALDRVAARAARTGRTIRCLVQVDFTEARQGVTPDRVSEAVALIDGRQGLDLAGLMTLPPFTGDPEATRPYFRRLRELRELHRDRWPGLTELSMGMSGDYEVAIEEGATMVRVGTALFGPRPGSPTPSWGGD